MPGRKWRADGRTAPGSAGVTAVRRHRGRAGGSQVDLSIEVELETDGRWIADVPESPGILAHGVSRAEAMARADVLGLRVLAQRIEHGEAVPMPLHVSIPSAAGASGLHFGHECLFSRCCARAGW